MAEKFSLKDELFNEEKVHKIASEIKEVFKKFKQEEFELEVVNCFPLLELKERIYHIRDRLNKHLPSDFIEAKNILLDALPPELDPLLNDNDFGDFIYAPYSDFIATFGCRQEYLTLSLLALAEMTKRFSVEFSIRDFINKFPKETLSMLEDCSLSNNYHQRRLASEGIRPKLPWGKKITLEYTIPIKLLNNLYFDKTRFVTRSVANHLNDISKIDASLVIATLKRWKASNKQDEQEMNFIIAHALRTLVKNGNIEALSLLGYKENPLVKIEDFKISKKKIRVGESLEFSFMLTAQEKENLMIDYVIFFQTKAGKQRAKVHKLKKIVLNKAEKLEINKKHLFKANMTTRTFYAGEHKIVLQINGKMHKEASFILEL